MRLGAADGDACRARCRPARVTNEREPVSVDVAVRLGYGVSVGARMG